MRRAPYRTVMLIREDPEETARLWVVLLGLGLWCGFWVGLGAAQWIRSDYAERTEARQ